MGLKSIIARRWALSRLRAMNRESRDVQASQLRTLRKLLLAGSKTSFGIAHGIDPHLTVSRFREQVPVRDYEAAGTFFERIRNGEPDVCWPGRPQYLAKTSGTTSGAKFIPITRESIRSQVSAARDTLLLYLLRSGNYHLLGGKMLYLGGSPELEKEAQGILSGRLSGIVNHHIPSYLQRNKMPSWETNCIPDWEQKVERMLEEALTADLRLISGIPPWVQMFFERLEARTGKLPLQQWPNLAVFVQGGVDFGPYREIFARSLQNKVDILEVFPASEGFFAFQDGNPGDGLRVNLGGGIYFEFVPLEDYGKPGARRMSLHEVELNRQYCLVVSTNAGLWAYDVGDTVRFVSLNPPRLVVTGRAKHFLSAFGEHVITEEVNRAMEAACTVTGAIPSEFTVAPWVTGHAAENCHEWWVEFQKPPQSVEVFAEAADQSLRSQNVYYDNLRTGGMLTRLRIRLLSPGATNEYMKRQGRLGGQNKFPRLQNNRSVASQLEEFELK